MAVEVTTVARVKAFLGHGGTEDDAFFAQIIPDISARFERYLDRHLESDVAHTDYLDVDLGQSRFWLRGWPNIVIATVRNATDWTFSSGGEIASGEYTVLGQTGLLILRAGLSAGPRALEVVHTGGMAADTTTFIAAFPDIAHAGDMQAGYTLLRRRQLGAASVSAEGASISLNEFGLMKDARSILDRHRRRHGG